MRWLVLIVAGGLLWSSVTAMAASSGGDVAEGEALFRANCAMCHGADATGMMGMHPALTGAVRRLSREGVEVTIRNGRNTTPPMPAFGERLDGAEVDALVAYLSSLPDGPRNFGPAGSNGMGGMGDMGGMMEQMPGVAWLMPVMIVLVAGLSGVVGYLLGSRGRKG